MDNLRLFADEGGPALAPRPVGQVDSHEQRYTLRQAWEQFVRRPHREKGKAESTLRDQRTHVGRWEEWCSNHRIENPMVHDIRFGDLADWQSWLREELSGVTFGEERPSEEEQERLDGVARNVNKHLSTVQQVLRVCFRRQLIAGCPSIDQLDCCSAAERIALTRDDVSSIYEACDCAEWPTRSGLTVLRWRTAVVIYSIYGLRTQEAIGWEADHTPLRWSNLHFAAACPANQGRETWEHGWLSYVPQKQRRKKPLPVVVPLHVEARRHLDAMRSQAGDAADVWTWPHASKSFYAQWHAICAEAAKRSGRPELIQVEVKHFRKTAHTWHKDLGGREIADIFTGHSPRGVSGVHYDVPYGRLCEHLRAFVVPEAFAMPLPAVSALRQLSLF